LAEENGNIWGLPPDPPLLQTMPIFVFPLFKIWCYGTRELIIS